MIVDVILDSAADAVNEAPSHGGYSPKVVFLACGCRTLRVKL